MSEASTDLQCPICQITFDNSTDKKPGEGSSFKMSHDARPAFCDDQCPCPVCHQVNLTQPMVNLSCGHTICQTDFGRLGGHVQALSQPHRTKSLLPSNEQEQHENDSVSSDSSSSSTDDDMPPLIARP